MPYNPTFNRDPRGNYPAHSKAGFVSVQAGTNAYLLEDEINEFQWIQAEARASLIRESSHSGFLDIGFSDYKEWFDGIYTDTSSAKLNLNSLLLHPDSMRVVVNGFILNMFFDKLNNNPYFAMPLQAPPTSSNTTRDDLVFLEAWFTTVGPSSDIKKYGGTLNSDITNDLEDIRVGAETTRRIQLCWNIRVVSDVDFATYPEGFERFGDPKATLPNPQCDLSNPNSNYVYHQPTPESDPNAPESLWEQKGLYIAGDGSSDAQYALSTVDGYSYALPLFKVRRRNTKPYNTLTNPFGAALYTSINDATQTTVYAANTVTFNLSNVTNLSIGQGILVNGAVDSYYTTISSITSSNNTITVVDGLPNAQALNYIETLSDRPDGLFSNVIDYSDIVDLRHSVEVRLHNLKSYLSQSFDKLLRGELTSVLQKTYVRDYLGTPAFVDDTYTLLLANFDGNTKATANNQSVNVVAPTNLTYRNGVTGSAVELTSTMGKSNALVYSTTVASNTTSLTIETMFKPTWVDNTSYGVFSFLDLSNNRDLSLNFDNTNKQFTCYYEGTHSTVNFAWKVPSSMLREFVNGQFWHKLMMTISSTGNIILTVDGVSLTPVDSTKYPGPFATNITQIVLGYSPDASNNVNATLDEFRVSNILRNETQLSSNFGQGDHIVNGPNGQTGIWGDNQIIGGLTYAPEPNQAVVYYNSDTVNNYYNSYQGWNRSTVNVANEPLGAFDTSALQKGITIIAETSETVFKFDKPSNTPGGMFLIDEDNLGVYNETTGNEVSATLSVDNAFNVTATTESGAIASGSSVTLNYLYGDTHAHFIPSIKGFEMHGWYDQTFGVTYANNPSSAPTITGTTGGSLVGGSGTMYYVEYTWSTISGETEASDAASINLVTPNNAIDVTVPSFPAGVVAVNIYVSTVANEEKKIIIRSTSTDNTITDLPTSNAATVPQANTAQIQSKTFALSSGTGYSNVISVNHVRVTQNGSGIHYIVPSDGLPANAPGGPGFAIPGWSITDTNGNVVALPSNSTAITFEDILPNGSYVDVVYEFMLVPSSNDTITVSYETVPYQGLIGNEIIADSNTRLPIIEVGDHLLVNTNGTGIATSVDGTGTLSYKYPPVSVKLPLGLVSSTTNTGTQLDNQLTNTAISFTTDSPQSNFAVEVVIPSTMRMVNYNFGLANNSASSITTGSYGGGSLALLGAEVTNVSNALLTPRGMAGSDFVLTSPDGNSANFVLYHDEAFTSSFTKQVVFTALVQLKNFEYNSPLNDELLLLVASRLDNTNTSSIGFKNDWTDVAFDLFHIPGRPLLR